MTTPQGQQARTGRVTPTLVIAGALAASLAVASLLGTPMGPGAAVGSLALKLGAMWPTPVYLLAAFGLAWPLARLWRGAPDALPVQAAIGLALMLSLSHLLGILGLLSPASAIGICAIGLALAAAQAARILRVQPKPVLSISPAWALAAPAAALLIVAAAMPPGWLWSSEFGGYDALSYHLQLPQEWLAAGRVEPLRHNVYSFLPGYMEAAFAHLGALTVAPGPRGLLGGDGWRLISCQSLHAGITLLAAWFIACAAARFARNSGAETTVARWSGAIAGGVALATPWTVVTGSLAYNEGGVNAMLAAALLVCAQPGLAPARRGAIVGLLVGVACGFKPTSLFFVGAPAGIALLAAAGTRSAGPGLAAEATARRIMPAILAGACVGVLALLPWLLRNAVHGGNPVFPFAAELFGSAHWTSEQLARWHAAHSFDGSTLDRLRTLVWTSPSAAPDAPVIERFRGFANPQWGLLLPMTVAGAAFVAARWRDARGIALMLVLGIAAQIVAWLAFTHLQSRFLLPVLPPAAILLGLTAARARQLCAGRPDYRAAAALLGGLLVLVQTSFLLPLYTGEKGGSVGVALGWFPDLFTGIHDNPSDSTAAGWCNSRPDPALQVYLVGDATPLYFGPGVVYHTTYDASPLGTVMRESPDEPAEWSRRLRAAGIGWLLVNPGEIARLQASGWFDPLVTGPAVRGFAESQGGASRIWQQENRYLVRLAEPGP